MDLLLPDDNIFFDIGSNWGYLSLYATTIPGYRGQIHAFEPTPPTYKDLADIVREVRLTDRIVCHNVACSDAAGTAHMVLPDGLHSGLATIKPGSSGGFDAKMVALDDCVLGAPQFIKIDVEGHEHGVIKGARKTIEASSPFIIFETWRGEGALLPFQLLRDLGYVFFHPYLLQSPDDGALAFTESPTSTNVHLALLPFDLQVRGLFRDQFNAFCCHTDRVQELRDHFNFTQSPKKPQLSARRLAG